MAEPAKLAKGDRVSWNTSQGRTRGEITGVHTKDFEFAGQHFTASEKHPAYIIRSEKSGSEAAHKRSALRKLST